MSRVIHAITPGDHFSPLTGSAIPTVVHGLAGATADGDGFAHTVVLERATMHPRYASADVLEYEGAPFPGRLARLTDALGARIGIPRRAARRAYEPIAAAVSSVPRAVVVAHNAPVLPLLLRGQDHGVVLYAHNDLFRNMSRSEIARCVEASAAVVCVSTHLADRMAARMPLAERAKVHVVDNGVDTVQFSPAQNREQRPLRVMFIGRTIAEKGPDLLLDAVASLGREDLETVIVGSHGFDRDAPLSAYEQSLRDRAGATGIRVRFEPFVDRVALPGLLRTADVFVAPSRWPEPSGLTIGEAMATGIPVIASSTGGIPEVLGDAGLLVQPDSTPHLAAAIDRLADDANLRAHLGHAARARAVERSWKSSWHQLAEILRAI